MRTLWKGLSVIGFAVCFLLLAVAVLENLALVVAAAVVIVIGTFLARQFTD